jgi:hypothetical protein
LFKPPSKFGPKTDAEYDAKLAALVGAITRMDPHVLAVQEVGDPAALQELADRVGGTWHIETADPEAGTDHAIRVGMLSRVVLTGPRQVAAFPDKLRAIQQGDGHDDDIKAMGRPALHVRVRLGGVDIEIITAHFKSKLSTALNYIWPATARPDPFGDIRGGVPLDQCVRGIAARLDPSGFLWLCEKMIPRSKFSSASPPPSPGGAPPPGTATAST